MSACAATIHDSDENPPPAETHATLCKPCRLRLRSDLRHLPGLAAQLAQLPVLRKRLPGNGDGLPIDEPAADCASQIRHDIAWWTAHAAADRDLDARPLATAGLAAMCVWLHDQAAWMVFRDWAADLADTIRADTGRARALIDPQVIKRFAITGPDGICPACHAGRIVLTVYASDGDRRRSFAACDSCGHEWLPESWMRLGQQIIRRREQAAS